MACPVQYLPTTKFQFSMWNWSRVAEKFNPLINWTILESEKGKKKKKKERKKERKNGNDEFVR